MKILKKGNGPTPVIGQLVSVQYEVALSLEDLEAGNLIDSSYMQGRPISFRLGSGEALRGVDEGVLTMQVGDLRRLIIPPHLAYGEKGIKELVPADATLFVELKLRYIDD